ncbi:MAG: hypothetical protein JST67_01620 [Bacteroidetes bacterium]|nr:hypothetical protein [Bacteroidota bacterium]
MKKSILLSLFTLLSFGIFSQSINKAKWEILGGIGPTGFLGDLGGGAGNGTHFVKDYNFSTTRFNIFAGIRYRQPLSRWAFRGNLYYGMVSGDDTHSKEAFRRNRNLNFRSPILELSGQVEFYIIRERTKRNYSISSLRGGRRKRKFGIYLFTGIGVFYYNPKEELNGNWYNVRDYHVEGQGLPGGPKQFSNFNIAIPIGIGYRCAINKKWSIGAELSVRKTFTDYIDGVSGRYYNKAALQAAYGSTAVALADPSLGTIPGATSPNADGTGAQRGDPKYKDSYMFFSVTVGYKFVKQHRTRAKF